MNTSRTTRFVSVVVAAVVAVTSLVVCIGFSNTVSAADVATVTYRTHVQDYGWQEWKSNGQSAGTTGESKRLEGINIKLSGVEGGITYKTHVQTYGWQSWKSDGAMSGTSGESKRLEAIQIKLTGEAAETYDVYYRVHAQHFGWLDWAKNGETAGTAGYAFRLESIQIKLVAKDGSAPGATATPYHVAHVRYQTHVQNVGWQGLVGEGIMSGTSGRSLRLEGIKIVLANTDLEGSVEYQTHVQNEGWQDWVKDGVMSGTSGKSYRLEGIRIRLTGEMAENYDIYYCTHVQNEGWQAWVKNGEMSGTSGKSLRLEGIKIELVEKGGSAPASLASATATPTATPTAEPTPIVFTYYRDTLNYHGDVDEWAEENGITLADISCCQSNWYNLSYGIDRNADEVYAQALEIFNNSAAADAWAAIDGYPAMAGSEFSGFGSGETKFVYYYPATGVYKQKTYSGSAVFEDTISEPAKAVKSSDDAYYKYAPSESILNQS